MRSKSASAPCNLDLDVEQLRQSGRRAALCSVVKATSVPTISATCVGLEVWPGPKAR